jgi:hypothetical protein
MANIQVSDVIIPERYSDYIANDNPETTALVQAGVAQRNALYDGLANGGLIGHIPYWNDLDASIEPNYGTDDPADVAVPQKMTTGQMLYRKSFLNEGWSSADLVADLMSQDPMQQVRNRTGRFWQRQFQHRTIAMLQGVLADNVANDGGDMVNDIHGALNSDVGAGTLISKDSIIDTAMTSDFGYEAFSAMAVHPVVYSRLLKNNEIDFVQDSENGLLLPNYAGLRLIVDKNMPSTAAEGALAGDDAATYTTILFGQGAIAFGIGNPKAPVEIEREAAQGNGHGIETLWERQEWLLHPQGFSFTSNTVTDFTPTLAQLRLAANWDRKIDRDNIRIAYLVTNG